MPKSKGRGSKKRRRGKNGVAFRELRKREVPYKEDFREYAQVIRVLGSGWVEAIFRDGNQRRCQIRGAMKKRVWVNCGDIVLVSPREFKDDKGDIVHKYYIQYGKSGKNSRRGKDGAIREFNKRELLYKEDFQEYAQVTKMLGGGWVEANCFDGKQRRCRIRGAMKKRVWINIGDIVLVSLREFEDTKGDVIHKYYSSEAFNLLLYDELPRTVDLSYSAGSGVKVSDFHKFGYKGDHRAETNKPVQSAGVGSALKIESTMKASKQRALPLDLLFTDNKKEKLSLQ